MKYFLEYREDLKIREYYNKLSSTGSNGRAIGHGLNNVIDIKNVRIGEYEVTYKDWKEIYDKFEEEKEMTKEKSATQMLEEGLKYREDLKLKADNGCLQSLWNLSISYMNGIYIGTEKNIEKDEKKVFELLLKLYDKDNDFCSQYFFNPVWKELALCHYRGVGTEIDCVKACDLYTKHQPHCFGDNLYEISSFLIHNDFIHANAERINKIMQDMKDKKDNDE